MLTLHLPPGRTGIRSWVSDWIFRRRLGLPIRFVEDGPADRWEVRFPEHLGILSIRDDVLRLPASAWLTAGSLHLVETQLPDGLGVVPGIEGSLRTFAAQPEDGRIIIHGPRITCTSDLIGSIAAMLGRYEEFSVGVGDEHGRFPAGCSQVVTQGLIARPLADEAVAVIGAAIERLWPGLIRKTASATLVPTHDLDLPLFGLSAERRQWPRSLIKDLLRAQDPLLACRRLAAGLGIRGWRDPFDTVDCLMALAERSGVRCIFHLMAPIAHHPRDPACPIDHPAMLRLLGRITERGHELGYHPSYGAAVDADLLSREYEHLTRVLQTHLRVPAPVRARYHYLRWFGPESWSRLADIGIRHDSSLGYASHPGFRAGTCHPYRACNLRTGTLIDIEEHPLAVMDTSLYHPAYGGLGRQAALTAATACLEPCMRHHGEAVILWHNTGVVGWKAEAAYRDVLRVWDRLASAARTVAAASIA